VIFADFAVARDGELTKGEGLACGFADAHAAHLRPHVSFCVPNPVARCGFNREP